jgi:Fic family protein
MHRQDTVGRAVTKRTSPTLSPISRFSWTPGPPGRSSNWIGGNDYNPCGADFVPPPPEYVDALLSDLCDAINNASLPPLVQAALVHAQFETIHPFDDGNGRMGRTLVQVILRRRGVAPAYVPPVSVVLAAERDRYIQGLTHYRADRVAAAATGRAKAAIHQALGDLTDAGVLAPLSTSKRNRSWEAVGLLDLIANLEAGHRLRE